jgi:hypothetical protein
MPELITETLLVVAPFKDRGTEYLRGDRVPVRHLHIRQIAREQPELFAMEYAAEPLDLKWLARVEEDFEEQYRAVKHAREEEKARRKRALREEFESQDRPQPELERRFAKQEADDRKREKEAREEREREAVERDIALIGDEFRSGFNF